MNHAKKCVIIVNEHGQWITVTGIENDYNNQPLSSHGHIIMIIIIISWLNRNTT